MLHAGSDLSRRRLDVCLLSEQGEQVDQLTAPPDVDSLRTLARRIDGVHGQHVCAVVESMTGARLVHDTLEQEGWSVEIADAQKVKGLAPLACKTDEIDSMVLAMLSHRDLVPAIWLPDPWVREERELARFRMHLVKHKSALKNRVHSTVINFGRPCPVSDLRGRGPPAAGAARRPRTLARQRDRIGPADRRPRAPDRGDQPPAQARPRRPSLRAGAPYRAGDRLGPGVHDRGRDRRIERFSSPEKFVGYTGLCPRVNQSGEKDRRGPLTKHGPTYLRWALLEATMHALRHPAYRERYQLTKRRLGKQRGAKVAQVDVARRLARAIWHMLTRNQEFAPRGARFRLAA
jgi:transposase